MAVPPTLYLQLPELGKIGFMHRTDLRVAYIQRWVYRIYVETPEAERCAKPCWKRVADRPLPFSA